MELREETEEVAVLVSGSLSCIDEVCDVYSRINNSFACFFILFSISVFSELDLARGCHYIRMVPKFATFLIGMTDHVICA